MELRHLRYFVAVAEELHFGRAAVRLHMAQPPLSQQIKQLEEELGFQLFHRTKRSVTLTAAGERFLGETRLIFARLDQAIAQGRRTSRGELGELAIGFVGSASYSVLPPILQQFSQQFPAVELTLRELTTNLQIEALRENRIDIGLVRPPIQDQGLVQQPILRESLVVALSAGHRLAPEQVLAIAEIAPESFILFPRILAPGLYDQIIALCHQGGFSPRVVQEAVQMQTIVGLVAADIGIALVPASLQNLQRVGVVYRPLLEETPQVEISLVWRQGDLSPTVQEFLRMLNLV
jgi:DNA-binding transcriptional LysR family regulator